MSKWIPVEEMQPPKFFGEYITTMRSKVSGIKMVTTNVYMGGVWSVPDDIEVTAWMPLPEAYDGTIYRPEIKTVN